MLKRTSIIALMLLCPLSSRAEDKTPAAPTVTLTQQELTQLVQAEVAAAIAVERAHQSAAGAYLKVQSSFAPKPVDKK